MKTLRVADYVVGEDDIIRVAGSHLYEVFHRDYFKDGDSIDIGDGETRLIRLPSYQPHIRHNGLNFKVLVI